MEVTMEKMKCFNPVDEKEKQEIIKDLVKDTAAFGIDLGTTKSTIAIRKTKLKIIFRILFCYF